MEDLVVDSKSLLDELSEQLLKKGKPVREIKDCFINIGQEDDCIGQIMQNFGVLYLLLSATGKC